MRKLLIVSSEFPPGPGGIGNHAYQMTLHLQKLGWNVLVITCQDYVDEKERNAFNRDQKIRVIPFQPQTNVMADFLYRKKMIEAQAEEFQPDLIVATGLKSTWLMSWCHFKKQIKWIAIGHGTDFGVKGIKRFVTRLAFKKATATICVSKYTQSVALQNRYTLKESRVICNGADPLVYEPLGAEEIKQFRKRQNLKQAPILLSVGHLSERKGQDIVIRALRKVIREVGEVKYLIVGISSEKEKFQNIAREEEVENHVRFMGKVDQECLKQCFNACDIFLMTSRHSKVGGFEGYGIAAVEAAMCGKPAIVSSNSGLMEAVINGETGLVVKENSVEETAKAIIVLLKNNQLKEDMGSKARNRAVSEQSWEKSFREYDAYLKQLIKK